MGSSLDGVVRRRAVSGRCVQNCFSGLGYRCAKPGLRGFQRSCDACGRCLPGRVRSAGRKRQADTARLAIRRRNGFGCGNRSITRRGACTFHIGSRGGIPARHRGSLDFFPCCVPPPVSKRQSLDRSGRIVRGCAGLIFQTGADGVLAAPHCRPTFRAGETVYTGGMAQADTREKGGSGQSQLEYRSAAGMIGKRNRTPSAVSFMSFRNCAA
ncbi:MAG: hypothetical protein K0S28_745 [Paucimonas sp.]|nr:hypothetical protein [Paucimonas sp.]